MTMHTFKMVCPDCRKVFMLRKPSNFKSLVVKITPLVLCPYCHPNQSDGVCAGCRLPFKVVGKHSKDLCLSCFWQNWRYNKIEKKRLNEEPEADSTVS